MRRTIVAVLVACALAPLPANASRFDYRWAMPEWRATWAAPKLAEDRAFAVRATDDAVYVAGMTGSQGGLGVGDLFLLRYALDGRLEWSRTWGGFELDQGQAIAIDDAGVWIAGSTASAQTSIALLRIGHDGETLLERVWAYGTYDFAQGVAVHDGWVYVAGFTQTGADRDLFVQRVGLDGNLDWLYTQGEADYDEAWDVAVDDGGVYVAGYTTEPVAEGVPASQALVLALGHDGSVEASASFGGEDNDEARALALAPDGVFVTGGAQAGRSTDVFVARFDRDLDEVWRRTTGGSVVGGGGYGIALGERGIYVAGGRYDFPAGGDAAIVRFDHDGVLEWSQIMGLPGFWDWGFDVDVRDGRFYLSGVLWVPGAEWYTAMTTAFREDFPEASLTRVAAWQAENDPRAARAMDSFWTGDFLRWAQGLDASDPGRSWIRWEGASNYGRAHGTGWLDTAEDPMVGEEGTADSLAGLADDAQSGNYALVRDYTGVTASLLDGLIRFRYYISHDRLIPQGGYLYVGEFGTALPPPPV